MKYHVTFYYLASGMEGHADRRDYGIVDAATADAAKSKVVGAEFPDADDTSKSFILGCLTAKPVADCAGIGRCQDQGCPAHYAAEDYMKDLIEKLRAHAASFMGGDGGLRDTMMRAADALEAKVAPVGEQDAFEAWAASVGYHTERDMFQREKYQSTLTWELWGVWQAGAAYQRAQQPQATDWKASGADYDRNIHANPDAKAWADFFVATFPGLADKHDLMLGWFANAMMAMHDYLKAQQPQSAEAVEWRCRVAGSDHYAHFPTKRCRFCEPLYTTPQPSAGVVLPERKAGDYLYSHAWNNCLDEVARLNGKEVGRG